MTDLPNPLKGLPRPSSAWEWAIILPGLGAVLLCWAGLGIFMLIDDAAREREIQRAKKRGTPCKA